MTRKEITAIPSALGDRPRPSWAGERERCELVLDRAFDPEPDRLEGVELARAILEAAEWSAMSPTPRVRAFARMLADWCDDGAAVPLDRWIGTASPGRGSMREAIAIQERNVLLRTVAKGESYKSMAPTAAATMLAVRWRRWNSTGRQNRTDEGRAFDRLARLGYAPLHAETIRKILVREAE